MAKFEFELGVRLRDKVSEVEGICIGRIEYLNGCVQYAIKPKVTKDGKVHEAEWIDSQQIEQIGDGIKVASKVTGGMNMGAPRL